MTRRELRENVFKMLFRVEFFDAGELSEQLVLFGEEVDHVTDKDFQYIAERYRDIYNHLSELMRQSTKSQKAGRQPVWAK